MIAVFLFGLIHVFDGVETAGGLVVYVCLSVFLVQLSLRCIRN